MKKTLLSIASIAIFGASLAQTNMDFETWSGGNPTGWETSNDMYSPITVTEDAGNGGGSSIRIESDSVYLTATPTTVDTLGFAGQVIPSSTNFSTVTFDYKTYYPGTGDSAQIIFGFIDNGQVILFQDNLPGTFSTWVTTPAIDLTPYYTLAADSGFATDSVYLIAKASSLGNPGNVAWFDNIVLQGSTGLYELFSGVEVNTFPNPTTELVTFTIENDANTSIEIFAANGSLVSRTKVTGNNTTVSLANEVKGTYVYNVVSKEGRIVSTGKIVKN